MPPTTEITQSVEFAAKHWVGIFIVIIGFFVVAIKYGSQVLGWMFSTKEHIRKIAFNTIAESKEIKEIQTDISGIKKDREIDQLKFKHHEEREADFKEEMRRDIGEIKAGQKEVMTEIKELIKGKV